MNQNTRKTRAIIISVLLLLIASSFATASDYSVVDTGQASSFNNTIEIAAPSTGDAFYGQDSQYQGHEPDFYLSGDGLTADDSVTGLIWQRMPDTNLDGVLESGDKLSWWDALDQPAVLNNAQFGGYDDWRLPSIKELYSLMDFRGIDPSGYEGDTAGLTPFLNIDVFSFIYGDESVGERIIDSQYWTTSEYVSTTMNGDHTVFGVNFADGRIKGYGTSLHGTDKTAFVQLVRGNLEYCVNEFVENGDDTVTDLSTGLMWMQDDSINGLNWQEALSYAEDLTLAGYSDWRLPNAKELQSLVDYSRSPATDGTAAIDPMFSCSTIIDEGGDDNFPCYWTGTTHENYTQTPGSQAIYVAFGEALGWMQSPFPPFDYTLMDVHGAGSQRSDPKIGNPADYPYGHGPQGDTIRIYNHVRCVRDIDDTSSTDNPIPSPETGLRLDNFPNPFNPRTTLNFTLPADGVFSLDIYNIRGVHVACLLSEDRAAGSHSVLWDGKNSRGVTMPSGVYFSRLSFNGQYKTDQMTLVR